MVEETKVLENQPDQEVSWGEFLTAKPPGKSVQVNSLSPNAAYRDGGNYSGTVATPDIYMHCAGSKCGGMRFFEYRGGQRIVSSANATDCFLEFRCSNCKEEIKTFAVMLQLHSDSDHAGSGVAFKYGEDPAFGPPIPSRLVTLIRDDRVEFMKGRRCEIQGLGIGAFIYYRRVVENQKNRIISEILRVAQTVGAPQPSIDELNAAIAEKRFTAALEMVKGSMPQSLLIQGQNPLALLHNALSDGVHGRSDQECLNLAVSVRTVLVELSERMSQVLKDEKELKEAVSILVAKRPEKHTRAE